MKLVIIHNQTSLDSWLLKTTQAPRSLPSQSGDSLGEVIFFSNFPLNVSTMHSFEKRQEKDRSLCLQKRHDGPVVQHLYLHWYLLRAYFTIHFAVAGSKAYLGNT